MEKKSIALLIPAHNEELVIKNTIKAAHKAGYPYKDIYVVSDGSIDDTYAIAHSLLHGNAYGYTKAKGKGEALKAGMQYFDLYNRYAWVTMSDADTVLDPSFKKVLRTRIKREQGSNTLAISGQVKTMKSRWISHYRSFEYALGQDFYKRIEGALNIILILPGCGTTFSTQALQDINYTEYVNNTLVEDYDLTLELHYNLKGKIVYEPNMVVWTQEPLTFADYAKQLQRWYRGWFQVAKKRLRFPLHFIDLLIVYFSLDTFLFILELIAIIVLSIIMRNNTVIVRLFLSDLLTMLALAIYAAIRKNRVEILLAFPMVYFLRYANIYLFSKAAIDVLFLGKAPLKTLPWISPTRHKILMQS